MDDLADAILYIIENYANKDTGEFINIGTGEDLTIRELAALIAEIVGYKGKVTWDQSKPDGTPRNLLDISRLKNLGWQPKVRLKEGVEKTYEEYLRK